MRRTSPAPSSDDSIPTPSPPDNPYLGKWWVRPAQDRPINSPSGDLKKLLAPKEAHGSFSWCAVEEAAAGKRCYTAETCAIVTKEVFKENRPPHLEAAR